MRTSLAIALAAAACAAMAVPAAAQSVYAVGDEAGVHAGQLDVPVNKSQVLRIDRPYAQALIGNPEIADVLPLTDQSLYVLGKKTGTTSLTIYDRNKTLIAVVDVSVGPDVLTLRRQLSELLPSQEIGARISNDSIVLSGVVSSAPAVQRAVQIAETYAPGKVVNMMSVGSSQQVMLEVRFSEVQRETGKNLGVGGFLDGNGLTGAIGAGASLTAGAGGVGQFGLGEIVDSFGILGKMFRLGGLNIDATLDALERRGILTTLAEPTLVALSGETASFLAGGEFPVPVAQGSGGGGDDDGGGRTFTVQWKPFGVSLSFTPTVLEDGIINLVVEPEVSSIDPTASITINGLEVPGLQTRRAKSTVELRDGESFALAGLLRRDFQNTVRQFPILGSIPIIGALFRSTSFQKEDTELVIIVTPRLVRPVPAHVMQVPTDRVQPASETELFLLGRTDTGTRTVVDGANRPLYPPPAKAPPAAGGVQGNYGHIVE